MQLIDWIDKDFAEIRDTIEFGKFFDTIAEDKGIDNLYLFNPFLGIDLIFWEDLSVKAIHYYSGRQKGVNRFMFALPLDLAFEQTMKDTRNIFGYPTFQGGGEDSILYGTIPYWDKYIFEKFSLHLQFVSDKNSIDLITIESLKNLG